MKKLTKNILELFFKIMMFNYIGFLIIGVLLSPIIFIIGGFQWIKDSYFNNKDLSYKQYLEWKKYYWNKK